MSSVYYSLRNVSAYLSSTLYGSSASSTSAPKKVHGFDEVTKNIDVHQFILDSRVTDDGVAELVGALERVGWKEPIFEDHTLFPLLALKAYKENRITTEQFSTVMLYYSVRCHYPMEDIAVYNLFDEKNAINETFIRSYHSPIDKKSYLSDQQIDKFYTFMSGSSIDQQSFFVIKTLEPRFPDSHSLVKCRGKLMNESTMGEALAKLSSITIKDSIQITGVNIFCDITLQGKQSRMVPSFGMMQAFLDALSPHNQEGGVQLTPRIGLSTTEQIRDNGKEFTRDVALAFPGTELPKIADSNLCPTAFEFAFHDGVYHAHLASYVDKASQRAFVAAYDILSEIAEEFKDPTDQVILRDLAERFIDMEFTVYQEYTTSDLPAVQGGKFWRCVNTLIEEAGTRQTEKLQEEARLDSKKMPNGSIMEPLALRAIFERIEKDVKSRAKYLLRERGVLHRFVEKALSHPDIARYNAVFHNDVDDYISPLVLLFRGTYTYEVAKIEFENQEINRSYGFLTAIYSTV